MSDDTAEKPDVPRQSSRRRGGTALKFVAVLFLGTGAAVLFSLVALFAVLWLRPAWLLNERTLTYVPGLAKRAQIALLWDDVRFTVSKPSFWTHRVSWTFGGLCADVPSLPLDVCARKFDGQLDLVWDFAAFPHFVHIENLGRWQLAGGHLVFGPSTPSHEPSTFDIDKIELPWILERATLEPSTLAFDRLVVMTAAGTLDAQMSISLKQSEQQLVIAVNDGVDEVRSPLCWRPPLATTLAPWRLGQYGHGDQTCLEQVSATAVLGTQDGFLRVVRLGPANIRARKIDVAFDSTGAAGDDVEDVSPSTGVPQPAAELPAFIATSDLKSVSIDIIQSSFTAVAAGKAWNVRGDLAMQAAPAGATLSSIDDVRVTASARTLCLDLPYADGCIDAVDLDVRLGKPTPTSTLQILAVHRASIDAAKMTVLLPEGADDESASPPPPEAATASSDPSAAAFDWRQLAFEDRGAERYHVQLHQVEVVPVKSGRRRAALARGKLTLELTSDKQGNSTWKLDTSIRPSLPRTPLPKAVPGKPPPQPPLLERLQTVTADVRVHAGEHPLAGPYHGKIGARAAFSTGERLRLTLNGVQELGGFAKGHLEAQASLTAGEAITLSLSARQVEGNDVILDGRVGATGVEGVASSTMTIQGHIGAHSTNVTLGGAVSLKPRLARVVLPNIEEAPLCNEAPPPGPNLDLASIKLDDCNLAMDYPEGLPRGRLDVLCPVSITGLLTSPSAAAHRDERKLTADFRAKLHAEGAPDPRFNGALAWRGDATVELLRHDVVAERESVDLTTVVHGSFLTSQKDASKDLIWNADGNLDLKVNSFALLVDKLKNYPYAIPAPLNVLDGATIVNVTFNADSAKSELVVPFKVSTDLQSKLQKLKLTTDGQFSLQGLGSDKTIPSLDARVVLEDIALTMPRISMREKLPMLFPDKRVDVGVCKGDEPKPEDAPSSFKYHVAIDTIKDNPIRISTNLTRDVIPIVVEGVVLDNLSTGGKVMVQGFDFEVFRRKATIKSFDVTLAPAGQSPVINGNIEFKYTDITINILVLGTAEEPIIAFESTPIRTEREIIAILLYGQDADTIDDDQLQTADNLSAAFADRMIGLVSLYLLASTPIESVRYNPATKTFNAKVRIDGKTSLNFGTTTDADQRVGVRHRLNNRWAVETDVSKDETTDSTSGTALLEWSKRF